MSGAGFRQTSATASDLTKANGDPFAEVVGGMVVEKAMPSAAHGAAQADLVGLLWPHFHGRGGGGRPGGWWIMTEVEVELEAHEVYRPDVAGWRRDRVPQRPRGRPIRERPDWVCEILSDSNADNDLVVKLRGYHRSQVPNYWIVDPGSKTLIVYRWSAAGYLAVVTAKRDEVVKAEPFDMIEIPMIELFGDEDAPA
jgi:Uma2 family endonuclease